MIPEKRFLNQIQQVLARLMQPLWLLDTEGTVLLPEENRSKINIPYFYGNYTKNACIKAIQAFYNHQNQRFRMLSSVSLSKKCRRFVSKATLTVSPVRDVLRG